MEVSASLPTCKGKSIFTSDLCLGFGVGMLTAMLVFLLVYVVDLIFNRKKK